MDWVIDVIEDRDNIFIRPPVANLDYMFAVVPCASPEPDLLTLDKLTVIAENYGLETVVIVTKTDLDPVKAGEIASIYMLAGYRVFKVSCVTGDGMEELRNFTDSLPLTKDPKKGYVSGAFAGVSGAGKSTVMTNLFPDLGLETGEVSRKTERGRHTTRKVELFPVRTGKGLFWLADTPGFSLLDFARFEFFPLEELPESFREFGNLLGKCRYRKCTHLREEGCAVLDAVADGRIASVRHADYITIYEEQKELQKWKRKQGAKDTL